MPEGKALTIEKLQIEVAASTTKAVSSLKKLEEALQRLNKLGEQPGFTELYIKLRKIASLDFSKATETMGGFVNGAKKMEKASRSFDKVGKSASKAQAEISMLRKSSNEWSYGGDFDRLWNMYMFRKKMMDSIPKINAPPDKEPNWNIPHNPYEAMRQAQWANFRARMNTPRLESANMEAEFQETTRLKGMMFDLKHAFDGATHSAKSFFKDIRSGVRDLKEMNKQSKKAYTVFSAMKTILMYSLMFSAVSAIGKGVTEGLQNVAMYSEEVNQLLTQYKTLSLQIKNSIGAAIVPILQTMLPLVQQLSNLLIDISNSINVIFSAINGNKTFIVAKKYIDDYVKSLGKLKGMAGMDQINVIGNQYNYSEMFETIDRGSKDVAKAAFNIIELASAIGLITTLFKSPKWAKSISVIFGKTIKWQKVLKKCAGLFSSIFGFAELMEGAIRAWTDGIDWGNFLQMLSGALLLTGGLWLMFGQIGAVIGLIVSGITLVVSGVKDLVENGRNAKNTFALMVGILAVGAGIAIAGFGWIPLAIAAVVAAVSALAIWGDKIQEKMEKFAELSGEWFNGIRGKVSEFFDNLTEKVKYISPLLGSVFQAIENTVEFIIKLVEEVVKMLAKILGSSAKIWNDLFHGDFESAAEELKKQFQELFYAIGNIFIDTLNFMIGAFESFVNFFVYGINKIIGGLNKISFSLPDWKWLGEVAGASFGINIPYVPEASLGRIPRFAEGGFPEDGLFMANSGEMVGRFINGQTAVANNEQIVEGISRGVYEATSEQSELLREQNKILMALLDKESGNGISISSITKGLERQNRRNGRVIVPVGN